MNSKLQVSPSKAARGSGFTLVEVVITLLLGVLLLSAVLAIVIVVFRSAKKTEMVNDALTNTRKVQEHLTAELSTAVQNPTATYHGARYEFLKPDAETPPHYSRIEYRVVIGSPAYVEAGYVNNGTLITLYCPADCKPEEGDFVMLTRPQTNSRLRITAPPTDGRAPGTAGDVTVNCSESINTAAGVASVTFDSTINKTYVEIHRLRAYEVTGLGGTLPLPAPNAANPARMELRWWPNTEGDPQIISTALAPTDRMYMFEAIPALPATDRVLAAGWQFEYAAPRSGANVLGGRKEYRENNRSEGIIHALTGNPPDPGANPGPGETPYASTTLRTTLISSTTLKTTTKGTTTVDKSTTTIAPKTTLQTTLKSTTTVAPKTTLKSTTTVNKSTTTVAPKTTLQTTTTVAPKTTLKTTTTVAPQTTLKTTLQSTTTKGTTTVNKTTTTFPSDGG